MITFLTKYQDKNPEFFNSNDFNNCINQYKYDKQTIFNKYSFFLKIFTAFLKK